MMSFKDEPLTQRNDLIVKQNHVEMRDHKTL